MSVRTRNLSEPSCPRRLTGEARKIWMNVRKLVAPGVLSHLAFCRAATLERYALASVKWLELAAWITNNLTTSRGRIHPRVRLWLTIGDQLLRIEREFGITPAARSKTRP